MSLRKSKLMQCPIVKKPLVWLYMKFLLLIALVLPDKMYLKWKAEKQLGMKLDLDDPKLFQEKLHWLKMNDRKPIYHQMVDKYEAKEFIASKVGAEYAIPTIGLYNSFDEIDFNKLPDKFVLKGTFDSGSYYICKDKGTLDIEKAREQLLINWKHDYYIWSREWPYKGLKHRIIAEPLLADPNSPELKEFKFFCFNGKPLIYQTCMDRNRSLGGAILHFFDIKGNLLDIQDGPHNRKSDTLVYPVNLDKMLEICRILSAETYFLRVDFFEVGNNLFVGEMTFYENGGWCWFLPEHWNEDLGSWIQLPIDK